MRWRERGGVVVVVLRMAMGPGPISLSGGEGQRGPGSDGGQPRRGGVEGRMNQHQPLMFNSNSAPTRNNRVRS